MNQVPFILQLCESSTAIERPGIDVITSEDPLPATLEYTADKYVLARGTLFTDVKHETTDDK